MPSTRRCNAVDAKAGFCAGVGLWEDANEARWGLTPPSTRWDRRLEVDLSSAFAKNDAS